ncbi:uncharacterized protein LOC126672480 [Mercurialis annua]|uniref:uncharacterized protein LOC126672480 n=1 Tax=Mercurialis annua TaxID=3986 RepID=UPI002160C8D5|nr:uncharacterized protein LOC126672480 [Mercurialis annua]
MEFSYNNSFHSSIGMAPYEEFYGRNCQRPVCWSEGMRQLQGPQKVQETVDKIYIVKQCLKASQDRQKRYTDRNRREMEYEVGEKEIIERIGPLAYRLVLLGELSQIHDVFHVSMLQKCRFDPSHVIQESEQELAEKLVYTKEPIEILGTKVKKLRNKEILMLNVRWIHCSLNKATWEVEEHMRRKYLILFHDGGKF